MKLVIEYLCDNRPNDEEIKESIEIVNAEDCIVRLTWFVPFSGWHTLKIKKGMTFEECKNKPPRCYRL